MKVAVLGSTGMLGNAVGKYFDSLPGYRTFLSFRNPALAFGNERFYFDSMDLRCIDALPDVDYVINCIGCVKQKDYDIRTYMKVNAQFPHFLANACEKRGMKLLHITTDCVFSGKRGRYHELDEPDCTDSYGISKELGEPRNCMVLRTSVIGEEIRANYSLLEWARSQRGMQVQGYRNHLWNGLTNLQYAKVCHKIIEKGWYDHVRRHVFSTDVNKYEMLQAFDKKYDLNLDIVPHEHPESIDRRLSTVYDLNDRLEIPPFDKMIEEL